ncbi:hypothetical protein I317_07218 [Kwoniella heveanensis CBS 569]|nr:hypothetical protein I317_07218 [Kwoniella heveanensis CBS 569]
MNITIDDTSPQFLCYSAGGTWIQDHALDDQTDKYFKQTSMATKTDGDSVSFTFNGTAVYIYGAKRANHGVYSTQLDGGSVSYQRGYDGTTEIQGLIYTAAGLAADKEHTVVFANLPSQTNPPGDATIEWWFDVDFAVVTTSTTGKVYTTIYDDTSSAIEYIGSKWNIGVPNKDYYNTTLHSNANPGDAIKLSFNGSSVQMFGGLYMDHGNYSVSLDGRPPNVYNGTFFRLQPQVALYTASGLEDTAHTITITNMGQRDAVHNWIDFDYAVVNSSVDPTTVNTGTTGTNVTGSTDGLPLNPVKPEADDSSSNIPAIAGGVVGGVVGLALVAVLAWFLHRRSQKNRDDVAYVLRSKEPMDLDGGEVKPFEHRNGASAYHYPLPSSSSSDTGYPQHAAAGPGTIPVAREIDHSRTPFLTSVPAPPASNVTSYPRSLNPPTSAGSPPSMPSGYLNPFSNTAASSATFSHEHGSSPQPSSAGDDDAIVTPAPGKGATTRTKSAGVALPYTARPPVLPPISSASESGPETPTPVTQSASGQERMRTSSFGSGRMYVTGREQDMGPVAVSPRQGEGGQGGEGDDDASGEMDHRYGTLPPDYRQTTEPLPGQRRP